ncbi:MAG: RNA methyltransferase [Bacteroidaceae bacterium]
MKKLKVTELNRITVEAFKDAHKLPLTMVLDDIRSLHNVGSVFRTADAFRIERIMLCGITAQPPMPEIHKTALGAEDSVSWQFIPDAVEAVEALKVQGYTVLAVEQVVGSEKLDKITFDPTKKYAFVMGNEVKGVQQSVVDVCHGSLEIPQYGTKHSLNVSVTAGIVMWEFCKQVAATSFIPEKR